MKNQSAHLDAVQGASAQRTELYLSYSEGAAKLLTPQCAKSLGGAGGLASRQAKAVRG